MQEIPLSTPLCSIDMDVFSVVFLILLELQERVIISCFNLSLRSHPPVIPWVSLGILGTPERPNLRRCERGSLKTYSQGIWKTARWAPTSYKLGYKL